MTYQNTDISIHDGEPIELFEFIGPGSNVWRYTSAQTDQVYLSNTYTAVPIMRSAIKLAEMGRGEEVTIEMPATLGVVIRYGVLMPLRSLTVTVYRRHGTTGDVEKQWSGKVTAFTGRGPLRSARVPSPLVDALQTEIPRARYQPGCNHKFGDARCTIVPATVATTITAISGLTVTVASDGGNPDGWLAGGKIVRDSDGEQRDIEKHVGLVLTLLDSFPDLATTNPVTLHQGCDHSWRTCIDKFANINNYGGHPHILGRDPYRYGVRA